MTSSEMKCHGQRAELKWNTMAILVSYIDDNIIKIVIEKLYVVGWCETLHGTAAIFKF